MGPAIRTVSRISVRSEGMDYRGRTYLIESISIMMDQTTSSTGEFVLFEQELSVIERTIEKIRIVKSMLTDFLVYLYIEPCMC